MLDVWRLGGVPKAWAKSQAKSLKARVVAKQRGQNARYEGVRLARQTLQRRLQRRSASQSFGQTASDGRAVAPGVHGTSMPR
jgi:hypothetical protein